MSDDEASVYALYDRYCHGKMERREFLQRAATLTVGGLALAQALLPDYARAETIKFTDSRITPRYVRYPSPGGNAQTIRGYLVRPTGQGPFPAVLVVHENRGLNPYVEDVARRLGVAGFLALAPDALSPVGGYPGNDDEGKALQSGLDRDKIMIDMANGARFVKAHADSNGKLGVTGFCFGGAVANTLAITLGADLRAAAPFYGTPGPLDRVKQIKARMLIHYAETDPRVNATRAEYEAALKAAEVHATLHTYPGTQHGFHNNSTPRFDEAAAQLAWQRTLTLFRATLS